MRSFLILLLTGSLQIFAQPINPSPQMGGCSFREHESTLSILLSDCAIIHWDSFSIQAGEITEFIQPSSQSVVLNRVTGNAASEILGNLHSNGHVILINPLGLYIGENGYIDTASFTGATLDIRDQDFLRGRELLFTGESEAKIVNLGRIESRFGDLFLIGRKIENKGILLAENGTVGLGAGAKVLLAPHGDRRITIEVGNGSIEDEGNISALAIELRAKNPYELAVQTKGRLEAFEKEEKNGRIYLVAEEGRTRVQGELLAKGGEVQVLGTEVLLDEGSFIDVSAPHGGGSVFVGGDYQGSNPFIKNADFTIVAPSARIDAQARESGEGGRVIVWADRVAKFSGEIDVCGGPEGGDGGFVEVSGLERFYYEGRCDRRAPFGKAGTLLLDPESDITINAAGPDSGGSFTGGVYTPSTSPSVIMTTTLVSELGLGNVVINTAYVGAGGGAGDVTVSDSFSWATANTLTVNCARTFSIGGGVTVSSTNVGSFNALIVNANSSGVTTGAFSGVLVNATGEIASVGGNLTLNGIGGTTVGSSSGIRVLGKVSTLNGTITLTGTGRSNGGSSDGVRIDAGGIVTTTGTGSIVATGTGSSTGSGNSGVTVIGVGSSINTQGGNITLTGDVAATSNCAGILVSTGGEISTLSGTITGNGTTSGGTSDNRGVHVTDLGSLITAEEGAIDLTGASSGSANSCPGILITTGGKVTSTGLTSSAATISLDGTGSQTGLMFCHGTHVIAVGTAVTSNSGNIFVKGTAGGTSDQNYGVIVSGTSTVSSTGTGSNAATITLDGVGGLTGSQAHGVLVSSASIVESVDGDMTFIGQGGGTTSLLHGILITGAGSIVRSTGTGSGAAEIAMTGTGGNGTGLCNGIFIVTSGLVESADGAISLTGTGDGASNGSGVSISNSGIVRSTGLAPITMDGLGSVNGTINNHGVNVVSLATIETVDGDVTITGTGNGSGNGVGVRISDSTLSTTGAGKFELIGDTLAAGTVSNGIFINAGGIIQSTGTGTLFLDGTGGVNGVLSYGIRITDNTTSVNSDSASITLVGRDSGGTEKGIWITDSGVVQSNISAPLSFSTFSDMDINEGGQIIGGSGPVQLAISRDLNITGGSGAALISGILLGDGNLIASIGRDLTLQGGTGASSHAQIGSRNSSSSANISFTSIGGNVTVDGFDLASFALIGHGDETLVGTTYSGNITFNQIGGNLSVLGADQGGGGFGFGQIGHLNSAGSTLSGNINATVGGSIFVTGGSAGATARARIGHGGNGALGAFGSIGMQLIANDNFDISSFLGAGAAEVVNESQVVGSGNLTIVVDNRFPSFPGFGTGAFILNGTLSATGQLRIYTVQPSQNIINGLINGQVFVAAPFNVDTIDQQYNVYFPGGTYTGTAFMVYYKVGEVIQGAGVGVVQIAETELQSRFPMYDYIRLPSYPWHHPSFCIYEDFDPGFDPYGSFIFEDNVYWIPRETL